MIKKIIALVSINLLFSTMTVYAGFLVEAQVVAGWNHTVGLKIEGTVVATGLNDDGQCNVGSWSDIKQIAAGYKHTVGLKTDGTVVATGLNDDGQCNVGSWSDIKQIAAGWNHTVGSKTDGTVIATGLNDDGQCNVGSWSDIKQIAAGCNHTVGLKPDGTVIAIGLDNDGQCNVGSWSDIKQVIAGTNHTVGLKTDGTVIAVGWNYESLYNVGSWSDIKQIAAGYKHTVGLKTDGTVVAVGDNWNGECDVESWDLGATPSNLTWYEDFDNDGFGNFNISMGANVQPFGYIADNTDCNDNDININPLSIEICEDGIDQDCNGSDEICTSNLSTYPASLKIPIYNTADFKIIGGSGFYQVVSNDESIATTSVTKSNKVKVTGKSEGTTTITVTDSNGESTSVNLKVTQVVKAIIVAGSGPYTANYLWDSTLAVIKYAYNVLQSQGFTNDTIAYYAESSFIDVDGDGNNDVDSDATNSSLKTAVTGWAADAKDVLIYMTGHGSDGKFKMKEFEHLDADVLNTWIKSLESKIPGKVTFVYDACQSGSFISSLIPESGKTRTMIASASKGENAYFTSLGAISFSNLFWTQIHNGANIMDAFINAKNSIEYSYTSQTPVLDDNGNGIGNDSQDGENTEGEFFGNGVVSAGDLPSIASISPSKVLKIDTSATIYADNVTDIDGIDEVWAVITPPDSYSSDPDTPVLSLPVLTLDPVGNGRYEAVYTDFTKKGNYKIAVFAKDTNGDISIPKSTSVIQSKGESHVMLDSALSMTMPFVKFQGTCYQINLDNYINPGDSSGLFWKLDTNSIAKSQSCESDCAMLDIDLNMTVPKIEYKGNFYQLQLKEYNNLNDSLGLYWKLDLNSVKAL